MPEPERKQIINAMINDLEMLPDDRLEQVRDFVEFLRRKTATPRRDRPDTLLRTVEHWGGDPEELDRLVAKPHESQDQEE